MSTHGAAAGHSCLHTCEYTCVSRCRCSFLRTHARMRTHAHAHEHKRKHTHGYQHIYMWACTHTRLCLHIHACTHVYAQSAERARCCLCCAMPIPCMPRPNTSAGRTHTPSGWRSAVMLWGHSLHCFHCPFSWTDSGAFLAALMIVSNPLPGTPTTDVGERRCAGCLH